MGGGSEEEGSPGLQGNVARAIAGPSLCREQDYDTLPQVGPGLQHLPQVGPGQ